MTRLIDVCDCGQPARGEVSGDGSCPAHVCKQCSAEHCLLSRYYQETRQS